MKHISSIANVTCLETARASTEKPIDQLSAMLVDSIFVKMSVICRDYHAVFDNDRKINAEKLQWTMALSKRGINRKSQIQAALDMLEEYKYFKPPQLGQFLEWCQMVPKNSRLPSVHEAFRIACQMNVQYSHYHHPDQAIHTVLRHTLDQIGATKFRGMIEKVAFEQFQHFYSVACRQFIEGGLKPIPLPIAETPEPHPIDKVKSNEARLKAMEAIRGMGIGISRRVQEDSK